MGRHRDPHYQRDWMRRFRAAHPEKVEQWNAARRAKRRKHRSRAEWDARRDAPMRECAACKQEFPSTTEFFVTIKQRVKKWSGLSAECRSCRNERFRKHYRANREHHVARALAYVKANPAAKRNRDALRYLRRKKRGNPPWANHDLIRSLYEIAAQLTAAGHPHEVDHVYPLIHPRMCGLHVPWNLRVVPTALNQAKGNRLPLDPGVVRDCTALL